MVGTLDHQNRGSTGEERREKLAIVAPAFLADGLETLEELNIGIREEFMEHGGTELKVINCLNDDQQWIEGLEQLIRKEFDTVAA